MQQTCASGEVKEATGAQAAPTFPRHDPVSLNQDIFPDPHSKLLGTESTLAVNPLYDVYMKT